MGPLHAPKQREGAFRLMRLHSVEQARAAGRPIWFIGNNIHHGNDISDWFVVLDRGRVASQVRKRAPGRWVCGCGNCLAGPPTPAPVPAYASGLDFHLSESDFCALFSRGGAMGCSAFKMKVCHQVGA